MYIYSPHNIFNNVLLDPTYYSLEGILNCSMDCYLSFTNVETLSCKPSAHKLNGIVDGTKICTKIL